MEAIAIPMPLWWRLLGRLYAFAVRLIPQEKQQTRASDRADQMAADALDTYGNAILRLSAQHGGRGGSLAGHASEASDRRPHL